MWTSISQKFFSNVFPSDLEIKEVKTADGEIDQYKLLVNTFKHSQYKLYPPSTKFCKLFVKNLITIIEGCGEEVDEDIYSVYFSFISTSEDKKYSYKSYLIQNHESAEDLLVLKESVNTISNGTTGLSAWQAAYFMAEWALDNETLFARKSVVELGSGTGLLGMVICKLCHPEKFLFTDHHDEVLNMIAENLSINGWMCHNGQIKGGIQSFCYKNEIKNLPNCDVMPLDWELVSDAVLEVIGERADIVVASDVVFDIRIIPSLVRVLKKLLHPFCLPLKNRKTAYICGAIRNQDTWDYFIKTCGQQSLNVRVLPFSLTLENQRLFKFVNHSLEFQIVSLCDGN